MWIDRRHTERERRQNPRVTVVFAVKNRVGDCTYLSQAADIAPGGMTLRFPKDVAYAPQTELAMCFELPGTGVEIAAKGIVIRDTPEGLFRRTGIRFTAVEPEYSKLIARFCAIG